MKTDEKHHGEIKKPGQAAKVVKGKALFYKTSKKRRNKTLISRAEYNHISRSCHVEQLNLLTGEVCTVFEGEQTQTCHEETPDQRQGCLQCPRLFLYLINLVIANPYPIHQS
jgi:hypothetical protein